MRHLSLTKILSNDFGRAIQQRGAAYFRGGRVRIESGSALRIVAAVRGSSSYRVELRREGEQIHAACTCPYFEDALCKHVWAVLMAAEAQRLLNGDGDNGNLSMVHAGNEDGFDVDDEPDEDEFADIPSFAKLSGRPLSETRHPKPRGRSEVRADWRRQLAQLNVVPADQSSMNMEWPTGRELLYVVDVAGTRSARTPVIELLFRDRKRDGTWAKPQSRRWPRDLPNRLPDADDRHILSVLAGASEFYGYADYGYGTYGYGTLPIRYRLQDPQPAMILPTLCRTGRCRLRLRPEEPEPQWPMLTWDDAEPWQFRLEVRRADRGDRLEVRGALWRGAERMDLAAPLLLLNSGLLFTREQVARYEHHGAFNWIGLLREQGSLSVPAKQGDDFMAELLRQPRLPPLDVPQELRYEEVTAVPVPHLAIKGSPHAWERERLLGKLNFDYAGILVAHDEPSRGIVQAAQRRVALRDLEAECRAGERLAQLGWRHAVRSADGAFTLAAKRLPETVRELTAAGWRVEAQGRMYRPPGHVEIQVSSGIDWFELRGAVRFGDAVAQLPELLAAAQRGDNMIKLGDGTFGLLPEEWLKRYGLFAGLGVPHEDHLRFKRSQMGLLDALLAAQPESRCDAVFAQARDTLKSFAGILPAEPPAGFQGELRSYQKEGLSWFGFLRNFGFGGCLADDMGLGKTVQVLALLESRRVLRTQHGSKLGPSLVVVPKSLVFNWKQEAARFAPRLRVLDHTGHGRRKGSEHFEDFDVLLTTYGTLRNDVADFKDVCFDYAILDEAQAIKNASSASAKAARLLQANYRLALSGTPVENHLGELWSLFEFLNPGMLGTASVLKLGQGERNPDDETRRLLAQALRPLLLRRTKAQVARELPPKVEQTLYCELESKQRKLYDELRDHYRSTLLRRIERDGLAKSKIQILEALLRLRQAAIHPGLVDKRRTGESSAKLDMLLPQLREVLDEGHKTLVFSQFTGMLALLREQLDRDGIDYEYLDGKTKNRQARVERFQSDADCRLFLISLKAGGVGLNLTAAQYIFLLDPWWNPAVEAQAIDRAHRIGQTHRVFAYRLIARDTIEEKVLALQNAKRDLADAIIGADNNLIRALAREDLELLLS